MATSTFIGTLQSALTLNSKSFSDGLEKSGGKVRKFEKGVGGLSGKLKGLASGFNGLAGSIAGFVGVGSLGALTAQFLTQADAIGKMSSQLGINAERLQGYQQAANRAGVDTNAFNAAISAFNRRLQFAQEGTNEYSKAIAALGLNAAQLQQQGLDQAFLRIADAIKQVESPSQRSAIAFKLFSDSGSELLPLFQQGGAAINAFVEEQRELGAVFDSETIENVERFNDSLTTMKENLLAVTAATASKPLENLNNLIGATEQARRGNTGSAFDRGVAALQSATLSAASGTLSRLNFVTGGQFDFLRNSAANLAVDSERFSDMARGGIGQSVSERQAEQETQKRQLREQQAIRKAQERAAKLLEEQARQDVESMGNRIRFSFQ